MFRGIWVSKKAALLPSLLRDGRRAALFMVHSSWLIAMNYEP
jgi:hypothetical protein